MKNLLDSRINIDLLKHIIKKQSNLLLIFTLILSITFPFVVVVHTISFTNLVSSDYIEIMIVLLLIASIALLMGSPFIFFNYLTSKKSVDFMHSLPIKRRDLFMTNTLISYLFVLIPFTIAYWSGYLLLFLFQGFSLNLSILTFYLQLIVLFVAIQLPSLFVIMNTGTVSDSLIYSIILFFVPFIAYGAYEVFTSTYIMGVNTLAFSNFLSYVSPAVAAFKIYLNPELHSPLILYWTIISVVVFTFTSYLYNIWKSELAEQPFNNPIFFNLVSSIFIGLLLVFISSAFIIDSSARFKFLAIENILIPVLFTFVTYIILDSIRRRSFQGLKRSIKRYSLIAGVTLVSMILVFITQGFGYSNHIPVLNDVQSVIFSTSIGFYDPVVQGLNEREFIITDASEIEKIIDVHQTLVDTYKKSNKIFNPKSYESTFYPDSDYDYFTGQVQFEYTIGKNRTFKRVFTVSQPMFELIYPVLEINTIKLNSNPLLLNSASNTNFKVYNNIMTESYSLDQNFIIETLKDELLSLKLDDLLIGYSDLTYIIIYDSGINAYQFNIDSRFPKTLKIITENIQKPVKENYEHYLVDDAHYYGTSSNLGYNYFWHDFSEKEPLNLDDLSKLKGRLFSLNLEEKNTDSLLIIYPSEYDTQQITLPLK